MKEIIWPEARPERASADATLPEWCQHGSHPVSVAIIRPLMTGRLLMGCARCDTFWMQNPAV